MCIVFALSLTIGLTEAGKSQESTVDSLENELSFNQENDTARVQLLLRLSRELSSSNPDRAQEYARQALKLSRDISYVKGTGCALLQLASFAFRTGDFDQAGHLAEESLRELEKSNCPAEIAEAWCAFASVQMARYHYDAAATCLRRALSIYTKIGDSNKIIEMHQRLSAVFLKQHNIEGAYELLRSFLQKQRRCGNEKGIGACLLCLGEIFIRQAEYDSARVCFRQGLQISEAFGNLDAASACFYNLGELFLRQQEYDSAKVYFQRCLHTTEQLGNPEKAGYTYGAVGNLYAEIGIYAEAMSHYRRSYELRENIGNRSGMAFMLNNIGTIHLSTGVYDSALWYCDRALALQEELRDTSGIADVVTNIGVVYMNWGNCSEAITWFSRAAALRETIHDRIGLSKAYNNIAACYIQLGKIKEALSFFERAFLIREELNDRPGIASILLNLGICYYQVGETEKAIQTLSRAGEMNMTLGIKEVAARIQGVLSAIYFESLGDLDMAEQHGRRALAMFHELGAVREMSALELHLSNIAAEGGNHRTALEHYRHYKTLEDSLYNEANTKKINELREKYDAERKEQQIDMLEQERAIQQLTLAHQADEILRHNLQAERKEQEMQILTQSNELQALELLQSGAVIRMKEMKQDSMRKESALLRQREAASRAELGRRNLLIISLIVGIVLLAVIAYLSMKRVQGKRREAALRAETAEIRARVIETESIEKEHRAQRQFLKQLIQSQEHERSRIASELHDELGQDIVFIRNNILVALKDQSMNGNLTAAVKTTGMMLDNVRRLARDLRPFQLERYGLARALNDMIRRVGESSSIEFTVEIDDMEGAFEKQLEINVYRIVQEGMNNIIRHADADEATIRIVHGDALVEIVIRDDGNGFDARMEQYGFGLLGMQQRVDLLNGEMRISSAREEGTTIHIMIPLKEERTHHVLSDADEEHHD